MRRVNDGKKPYVTVATEEGANPDAVTKQNVRCGGIVGNTSN